MPADGAVGNDDNSSDTLPRGPPLAGQAASICLAAGSFKMCNGNLIAEVIASHIILLLYSRLLSQ